MRVIALAISLVIGYMIARAEASRESFDIDAEREKQKLLAEADFNEALGAQGETQKEQPLWNYGKQSNPVSTT